MIRAIISSLSGGLIKSIGQELNEAYRAKLNAQNTESRIEAEKRIATLEAQKAILIAEQQHGLTRWIRPAFALIFWIYLAKVTVWDKVLGLGVTDPLSGNLEEIMMIIIGGFFLVRPFEARRF